MNPPCTGLDRQLLQHALKTANIPKGMQQRVLDAADTYQWYAGFVYAVEITGSGVRVHVEGHGPNSTVKAMLPFRFPPNSAAFEAELTRAQSDGCTVLFYYQVQKDSAGNDEPVIVSLSVQVTQEVFDLLSK